MESSFIYLILNPSNGHYKLGFSDDPQRRLAEVQIGNSIRLELHYIGRVSNVQQLERTLHARFSAKHLSGEWFALSGQDVAYVKAIENDAAYYVRVPQVTHAPAAGGSGRWANRQTKKPLV